MFMEVDNGYVARPGLPLKTASEVDRAGIKVAVAQGSAPDGFLTRTLKNAEIVRVPGGLAPAREALAAGRADVFADNTNVAHQIAKDLPGATVLDGRFNVVQMSIAVPKHNAAALTIVDDFVRDAKRDGLIAQPSLARVSAVCILRLSVADSARRSRALGRVDGSARPLGAHCARQL